MYAVVDIVGQQFRVEQGKKIFVHRLQAEAGSSLVFDKVLLTEHDGVVNIGTPYVEGVLVKATLLGHTKGNKVIVFKKKRRKGHEKKNGHRQFFTQIHIDEIV